MAAYSVVLPQGLAMGRVDIGGRLFFFDGAFLVGLCADGVKVRLRSKAWPDCCAVCGTGYGPCDPAEHGTFEATWRVSAAARAVANLSLDGYQEVEVGGLLRAAVRAMRGGF